MKTLQEATRQQLEQAAADNHKQLFAFNASSTGGKVVVKEGLTYTFAPNKEAMIAFPSLTEETAGDLLDEMMDFYQHHLPQGIGCWSLNPPQPADLGLRLLARGFQQGWQPGWMALDLEKIKTDHPRPKGLEIIADNHTLLDNIKNLPYAGSQSALSLSVTQSHPEQAQRFIAILDGKIVAHSAVVLTEGEYGTAGLYNVGVLPRVRNLGIGKAIVIAACEFAKRKGYRYAVLNGTGRKMYQQIGFQWISNGLTWWLVHPEILQNPPSKKEVAIAEAVGRGDLSSLDALCNEMTAEDFNKPIANKMTWMQLAVYSRQHAVAEWLAAHGAICSVLDAWNLGWKEKAAQLLQQQPALVNQLYEYNKITLLHIAADRRDAELAKLALSYHPDLSIKDTTYNATALGWAEFLKSTAIAELIKKSIV